MRGIAFAIAVRAVMAAATADAAICPLTVGDAVIVLDEVTDGMTGQVPRHARIRYRARDGGGSTFEVDLPIRA